MYLYASSGAYPGNFGRGFKFGSGISGNSQGIPLQPVTKIMHTQNLPLGSTIVCSYLAETYTAVYVVYEHYNPTVLLMKLANLHFWIAY